VRYSSLLMGMLMIASTGNAAFADSCVGGQQPAPPALARRLALPSCGFAATESWGSNGCQLCDAGDKYPGPYAPHVILQSRSSRFR
jgi:hypothetical protein